MAPVVRERQVVTSAVNTRTLIVSSQAVLSSRTPGSLSASAPPVLSLPRTKDAGCSTKACYFYLGEKKLLIHNGECCSSIQHQSCSQRFTAVELCKAEPRHNFHASVLLFSSTHLFPYRNDS